MYTDRVYGDIQYRRAISPTRVTDNTAQVSQIIDLQSVDACVFVIATGTIADADATFVILVDEGNNAALTDAAAAADADLLGTEAGAAFTFADDNETRKIGYKGSKRYVRLTITPANNTGNADISAVAVCYMRKGAQTSQG